VTLADRLDVAFEPRHRELAQRVARFARERIEPVEEEGGDEDFLARRFVGLLRDEGLLAFAVPGAGPARFDCRALCLIRENLARASGFCDVMFAMQGLGSAPITLAGSDAQKRAWLPRVADGSSIAAFALTEPEAGSDVAAIRTTATRDGENFVLNGTKTFISNAGVADVYTVFARTDPAPGHTGLSAFVVSAGHEGFEVIERQRVTAPHPIGTIRFSGCRVSAEALLGRPGDGFGIAMKTLDVFRPTVGAAAVGLARRALAEALRRARERSQFGQPIAKFQMVQSHLAHMAADVEAAALLVYRAATRTDAGKQAVTRESSMAKWIATEAAQRVVDRAVQIFGGAGVLQGSVVERLYREVRALRIYEGTSEIQQVVIATRLLKDDDPGY
jgi:acyl-CoA dehydrogenase